MKVDRKVFPIADHVFCVMLTYLWDNSIICDVRKFPSSVNKNQTST